MRGGKYLAEERGAFDLVEAPAAVSEPEGDTPAATVPLYEAAAAHDGQPSAEWLRFFLSVWRAYGDED